MKWFTCVLVMLSASAALAQAPPPVPVPQPPEPQLSCAQLAEKVNLYSARVAEVNKLIVKWQKARTYWTDVLNFSVAEQQNYLRNGEPTPPGVIEAINTARRNLTIVDLELHIEQTRLTIALAWYGYYRDLWLKAGCH